MTFWTILKRKWKSLFGKTARGTCDNKEEGKGKNSKDPKSCRIPKDRQGRYNVNCIPNHNVFNYKLIFISLSSCYHEFIHTLQVWKCGSADMEELEADSTKVVQEEINKKKKKFPFDGCDVLK